MAKGLDRFDIFFFAIFTRGNFCDFLFAFLHTTLKEKNLLTMEANSFFL